MASPEQRSAAARIASHVSWARTPNRQERTAPAIAANPGQLAYWEARVRAEGRVREQDIRAAAENYRQAYMAQLGRKSAASRAAKKKATSTRTRRVSA